jgi:hypothetical protein
MVEGRERGIDQMGLLQLKDPGKIRAEYMKWAKVFNHIPTKRSMPLLTP